MNIALRLLAMSCLLGAAGCDALKRYQERSEERKAQNAEAKERTAVESRGEAYRVEGTDFSIAVPPGYITSTDKAVLAPAGPNGLVIQAKARPNREWFLASIAIVSAGAGTPPPTTAEECTLTGKELAKINKASLVRAELVPLHGKQTCQWETTGIEDTRHNAIGTVVQSPGSLWAVTCNQDGRDSAAKKACTDTLASWKNNAP